MKTILRATASLLALGLFGCAVETSSSDTEASSQAVTHAPVVGEFQHCGGSVRHAPVCDTGLKCQLGTPADKGGICVKTGVGKACGGSIRNPPACDPGLECVLGPIADKGGTCNYAKAGETCGGFLATAVECGPNLQCTQHMDRPGICIVVAQKGEHCGGSANNAPVCATGLVCVLGSIPDKGGICE